MVLIGFCDRFIGEILKVHYRNQRRSRALPCRHEWDLGWGCLEGGEFGPFIDYSYNFGAAQVSYSLMESKKRKTLIGSLSSHHSFFFLIWVGSFQMNLRKSWIGLGYYTSNAYSMKILKTHILHRFFFS